MSDHGVQLRCIARMYWASEDTWQDVSNTTTINIVSAPAEYLHDFTTKQIGAWTHSRGSIATAPDETGIIQTYASGEPAWYRDQGLQLEDTRTNEYTVDEGNLADWAVEGGSGSLATSIPNNVDIITFTEGSGSGVTGFRSGQFANVGTHPTASTVSCYLGRGSRRYINIAGAHGSNSIYVTVDTDTWTITESGAGGVGVLDSFSIEQINATSARVSVTGGRTDANLFYFYCMGSDTATPGIYNPTCTRISAGMCNFAIAQYEAGGFATSGIITAGSTYTRTATSCSATFAQLGDPLPAGGVTNDICFQVSTTLLVDMDKMTGGGRVVSIYDSLSNVVNVQILGGIIRMEMVTSAGNNVSVDVLQTSAGSPKAGDVVDFRGKISATDGAVFWVNGSKSSNGTATYGFGAAVHNAAIGMEQYAGDRANVVAGKVRIVPESLSDEDIQNWT